MSNIKRFFILGVPLYFEVECIMEGYNSDTTKGDPIFGGTFKDKKGVTYETIPQYAENEKGWTTNFNITDDDVGEEVKYAQGFIRLSIFSLNLTQKD